MADDIVWEKSLSSALAAARERNKLVLATFLSSACEPCIRLNKCTLLTESVQAYIRTYFIPLKYESGADSEQFIRFAVSAKPAIIVLDSEGNEIFRKIGYFEPDSFIEKLEKARKKAGHRDARRHSSLK